MALSRISFSLALLGLTFTTLFSTTYYIDAINGSDTNDGLSPSSAWQTLAQTRNFPGGPQPGDQFLLKRGCTWNERMYIDYSGTANLPITYGAYGSSSDPLPIITTRSNLNGDDWQDPANWTEDSPNIWHKTISLAPPRLYIDGAEVLRSRDSTNLGAADNTGAIGEWFAQAGATDIYLFANQNPALIYSSIEAADQPQTIIVDFSNYLVFENLDIRGATLGALMLFGSQGTIIRNCKIGAGSRTGLIVRNGSQDITIEDNTFDSEFTLFYGNGSERGCSDGVILINGANDCIVRNNTVRNWAHNGIELLNQTSTSGSVNNNEIAYNFITAPDIPYAHPFGADGSEGNCQNNRFHHNTVVDCRTVIQVNGNDNRVDHNIITGMLNSPSQNRGTAFGIAIGVYGSNLVCHDNVYDHNLIADTDEAGFQIRSFGFSELAYNNQIRNNIFLRTGLSPYPGDYPEDLGLIIYDETGMGAGLGPNTFQNNLFFNENSDSSVIFIEHNNVQLTPTAFNATNGQEGNMVGDNLYGEPIFQTFGGSPYYPQVNSPVIDAGLNTMEYISDFLGQDRLIGTSVDIGPIEASSIFLPVEWGEIEVVDKGNLKTQISWTTLIEEATSHFEIERAGVGQSFEVIAREPARGAGKYQRQDMVSKPGVWTYRIRSVDFDGSVQLSPLVSCEIKAYGLSLQQLGPHHFRLAAPEFIDLGTLSIDLFDSSGRIIRSWRSTIDLQLEELPRGVYTARVSQQGQTTDLRLVH